MKNKNPKLVFWIIWAAILGAMLNMQFLLGGGLPKGENAGPTPMGFVILCTAVITIASVIRWIVIPKIEHRGKLLVAFIAGVAFGESAEIYSLFLIGNEYPETQLAFFILSFLAVFQFIPTYLKPTMFEQSTTS